MNDIKIVKLDVAGQKENSRNIANVYKEVFGSDPWNEGYKCPECVNDNIYPLSFTGKFCPKCSLLGKKVELDEYWPVKQVISDFNNEMRKTGAICCIANDESKVIGFAWGYDMSVNEETDKHLEAPGLFKIIGRKNYRYIDEVAVLPKYRNMGIGKSLVTNICKNDNFQPILLRTKYNSPAFRMFLQFNGKVVLNITRDRVIMILNP